MKTILPKGTVAVRCFDDTKNVQSILTPPGSTLLVIPSSGSKGNGSILRNIKVLPTSKILAVPVPYSLSTAQDGQHQIINSNKVKIISRSLKKSSSIININPSKSNSNGEQNIGKLNKPTDKSISENKISDTSKKAQRKGYGDILLLKDNLKNKKNVKRRKKIREYDINYQGNDSAAIQLPSKFNSFYEVKSHTGAPHVKDKLCNDGRIPSRNQSRIFYGNSNDSGNRVCKSSQTAELQDLKVGSPPSYEAHVCSSSSQVMPSEDNVENSPQLNREPLPFPPSSCSRCPQESDIAMYISPNAHSCSLPSNLFLNYETNDNHGTNFQNAELAINFESNNWCLPNYAEEEPRDYSSNSTSHSSVNKQAVENVKYIQSFVENAKMQNIAKEKSSESSYEERRQLAQSLLKTTDTKTNREKALRENFWIVEDEPLEEFVLLDKNSSKLEVSKEIMSLESKSRPSREYICHICGKMLRGRSSLRLHLHLHMNLKPYECQHCPKRFTQMSVLKNHVRIHTGETPYSCYLCGKSFKTQSILHKHLTKHSKLRAFKCCVCSKAFKSKVVLQCHLKIHMAGPHVCRVCDSLFDTRKAISTHTQRTHKNQQKKFFCTICNKGYRLKCILKQHMNVHSNEQKHSCYVCGASYVWRSGLAAHLRTHSFRIQCEICGIKFISLKKLEKHRSRHSEPFPHKCSKCERQFKFSYLLKKHLAKHKTELSCAECGLGFVTKTKLKKHLKIHSNSKLAI